ncbi:hypothetical protein M440DRAFT_1403618 [Trichoderma longibrachiatum ATCC 18648]|uniref:Uncharacterized protein n=1 Tax=Trichoderma longibrachiatum ATCC 18648 TaxID=983965 RepID=A0A2T4BY73_TRILO|nr:hypothetical protein M440DRAFT_1403618 [Trichoderma longibrachiatum ATCC 18648]
MEGCSIPIVESGHCLTHSTHLTKEFSISIRSNRLMNYGGMVSTIANIPGLDNVTWISIRLSIVARL